MAREPPGRHVPPPSWTASLVARLRADVGVLACGVASLMLLFRQLAIDPGVGIALILLLLTLLLMLATTNPVALRDRRFVDRQPAA